ncbi:MAG TPA: YfhO family protein, partial [Candidatus Baltobacteraceae bacterium]|nr:YfhO family protein [Candidatus Baltobacteraceae bacterium]
IFLQLLLLAVLPVDALTHSPGIAPTLPAKNLAPGIWQASGKPTPPQLGAGRIMIHPDAENELLYSRVADMSADFTGKRLAEWYNFNLLDGIPKVTGPAPLQPAYFGALEKYIYYTSGSHCGNGLVDFLSVEWISSPDNPTKWQRRTNFLPVITGGQRPIFQSDEKTLESITAENFEPREIAYLPEAERELVTATNQTECKISNVIFDLNKVQADVSASAAGLVVISQSYYHLWCADVDGKSVQLFRANLAFQAIEVPAGTHHIRLIYRDRYFEIGAVVSVISLATCGLILVRRKKVL